MAKELKFEDIKKMSVEQMVKYCMETNGVEMDPKKVSKDELLKTCASIFLNKRAAQKAAPVAAVIAGKKEEPKAKKGAKPTLKREEPASPTKKQEDEVHPRCGYCAKAITDGSNNTLMSGAGKPVCKVCAEKFPSKIAGTKEEIEMAKKTSKAAAKKVVAKKKGNPDALKKAREAAPVDVAGFRIGSMTGNVFQAIMKKACTMDELKKLREAAPLLITAFQKKATETSAGRSAVIKHDEGKGTYKLVSFVDKEGKTHKV